MFLRRFLLIHNARICVCVVFGVAYNAVHYFRVKWEERWIKAYYPVGKHAIKAGGVFSTRIQQRQFICARAAQKSSESRKTQTSASTHSLKIAGIGQKCVPRASIDFHANLVAIPQTDG
jgi:hypothetical protein